MSHNPYWWDEWVADVRSEAVRHASPKCEAFIDNRWCGEPVTTVYPMGKGLSPMSYCAAHKGRMEPGKFGVIELERAPAS